MKQSIKVKQMIIDNYIDWYEHDIFEADKLKDFAWQYICEDHVDEIAQVFDFEAILSEAQALKKLTEDHGMVSMPKAKLIEHIDNILKLAKSL
jgi:hypothetical protein